MKIYLVLKEEGEYDEYREVRIQAFISKEKAEKFIIKQGPIKKYNYFIDEIKLEK